jgi:hypothetical protein
MKNRSDHDQSGFFSVNMTDFPLLVKLLYAGRHR